MTRRSGTRRLRGRRASRKNHALRRWLVRFATQPDDRGQQWWEDFDAMLRSTRMRPRHEYHQSDSPPAPALARLREAADHATRS